MLDLSRALGSILLERGIKLVSAESCTGGMIAVAMTEEAGASRIFDCGFTTYSNESKMALLGVSYEILKNNGAVSAECAIAMVQGALEHSNAGIALATTGIAGPAGATDKKPIGLVYIACGLRGKDVTVTRHVFTGDRADIRKNSTKTALELAISCLKEE